MNKKAACKPESAAPVNTEEKQTASGASAHPSAEDGKGQPVKVKRLKFEDDGTPLDLQMARSFLSPVALNTIVAETFIDHRQLDLNAAVKVVRERAERVIKSDLGDLETTLVSNIAALDAIFGSLAVYAQAYLMAGKLPQFEMLMRVALKAQSQSRTSVDSLAELKNPRPIYAKNFNVANGNQQVNNAEGLQQVNNQAASRESARAENPKASFTNKLLEPA